MTAHIFFQKHSKPYHFNDGIQNSLCLKDHAISNRMVPLSLRHKKCIFLLFLLKAFLLREAEQGQH